LRKGICSGHAAAALGVHGKVNSC